MERTAPTRTNRTTASTFATAVRPVSRTFATPAAVIRTDSIRTDPLAESIRRRNARLGRPANPKISEARA